MRLSTVWQGKCSDERCWCIHHALHSAMLSTKLANMNYISILGATQSASIARLGLAGASS